MSIAAGSRLGPYEIVTHVGTGGMGEVYKARDARLNRTVAIKTLRVHLTTDAGFRSRLIWSYKMRSIQDCCGEPRHTKRTFAAWITS